MTKFQRQQVAGANLVRLKTAEERRKEGEDRAREIRHSISEGIYEAFLVQQAMRGATETK